MIKISRFERKDCLLTLCLCLLLTIPCFYRVFRNGQEPFWYYLVSLVTSLPLAFALQRIRRYWLFALVMVLVLVSPFIETFLIIVYQDFIRTGNFLSVFTTNKRESGNFFANNYGVLLYEVPVVVLFIATLVLRKRGRSLPSLRPSLVSLSVVGLIALCGFRVASCPPYNLYLSLGNAVKHVVQKKMQLPEGDDMLFQAKRPHVAGRETYVMCVGESLLFGHTSFSGYERNTTPLLASNPNVVAYTDYTSTATLTYFSIPLMLSRATPSTFNVAFKEKTILSPYKETGFHCSVIVSCGNLLSKAEEWTRGADEVINVNRDIDIAHVIDSVSNHHEKNFFLVQMLQSHSYYNNFEPEYEFYRPNIVSDRDLPPVDSLFINAYDNTVHYTDYVLDSVMHTIDKPGVRSAMLFASDHGEILRRMGSRRGTSLNPKREEFHVAMFFWHNDVWATSHAAQVKAVRTHRKAKVNADNLFYTLCQMADIQLPSTYSKDEWSLLSDTFKEHPRQLLLPDSYSVFEVDKKN